jgi:exodeoxyribonuclease V alpha subunit
MLAEQQENMDILVGEVERVTFRNADTGYSVLKVKVSKERDAITLVCKSLAGEGEVIQAVGQWTSHPKFGKQFQAQTVTVELPSTSKGIERYLAAGVVPGIGAGLAKKLVAAFGAQTLDVLEREPERLLELQGVGKKTVEKIHKGWEAQREAGRVVAALADYDVGIGVALRIWRKFGSDSLSLIQLNPYRLTEVQGVGFLTADSIAQSAGIAKDDPGRIVAGLRHVLGESVERGHVGVPLADFGRRAFELLQVPRDAIQSQMGRMSDPDLKTGLMLLGHPERGECVFSQRLLMAEAEIAAKLNEWRKGNAPWNVEADKLDAIVDEAAKACGVALAPAQAESVKMALTQRVSILTGGPGTGKTSTLKVTLQALRAVKAKVILGAPTGKAAKRMQETTGMQASTVARLIGMGRGGDASEVEIDADILILDEASMIDVRMMRDVLKCMVSGMAIMLVGDVDQLPSVGPGNVLADLIDSGRIPTTRLTQVFRQAAESAIIRSAHRVNHGELPEDNAEGSDFYFVEAETPEAITAKVMRLVTEAIPRRFGISPHDIQVLSPMRKSSTGVEAMNALLQQALNPDPPRKVERGSRRFGVGDRLLQCVNNYDLGVMNGETGVVVDMREDDGIMVVDVDGKRVEYPFNELDQLTLAYAMSIHKSQGSQFPAVVIPVSTAHYVMLQRAIVYTGITRASKLCILVGQTRALKMAVRNVNTERRLTLLRSYMEGVTWAG